MTRDGALYLSSSGNEGNLTGDGTSGNYEGDFVPSGRVIGKYNQARLMISLPAPLSRNWTRFPGRVKRERPGCLALGGSTRSFRRMITMCMRWTSAGNVVRGSPTTPRTATTTRSRSLGPAGGNGGGRLRLAVVQISPGQTRYFQLSRVNAERFLGLPDSGLAAYATPGVTRGHSTVPAAISVRGRARPPARSPSISSSGDPANPAGPFPPTDSRQHPAVGAVYLRRPPPGCSTHRTAHR